MPTETDTYPIGPTIEASNRLRAQQGVAPIGTGQSDTDASATDAPQPEAPSISQEELENKVNGWQKDYEDLLLHPKFNGLKDKQTQKSVVDGLHQSIDAQVDDLHGYNVPAETITSIRHALEDPYKVAHAMVDSGDRPVTQQQINDDLDKRHADLRELPAGEKKQRPVHQASRLHREASRPAGFGGEQERNLQPIGDRNRGRAAQDGE